MRPAACVVEDPAPREGREAPRGCERARRGEIELAAGVGAVFRIGGEGDDRLSRREPQRLGRRGQGENEDEDDPEEERVTDLRRRSAVIADDHPMMRAGIRAVLEGYGNVDILEEVATGLDAVRAARTRRPDLFVLDIAMPYARGLEVFVEIRRQSPASRIAVVTGLGASGLLAELVAAGVDGLFLKRGDPEVLERGLRLVLQGARFVAPDVVERLEARPPGPELSPRERQTLGLVAQGLTNAEIAGRLNLSPKTVEKHRTSLMQKLGVRSMSELLAHALREGLLDGHSQD